MNEGIITLFYGDDSLPLSSLRVFWLGTGGDWWPLRESEEEEERGSEEGWPLGGVAFPGNGLCSALLGPACLQRTCSPEGVRQWQARHLAVPLL